MTTEINCPDLKADLEKDMNRISVGSWMKRGTRSREIQEPHGKGEKKGGGDTLADGKKYLIMIS